MAITLSLVAIFGALAYLLIHYKSVGVVAFAVVFTFGFLVASTPAAEPINKILEPAVNAVTSIGS